MHSPRQEARPEREGPAGWLLGKVFSSSGSLGSWEPGSRCAAAHPYRRRVWRCGDNTGHASHSLAVQYLSCHLQHACRPTDRSEPETQTRKMPVREKLMSRQLLASCSRLEEIQASSGQNHREDQFGTMFGILCSLCCSPGQGQKDPPGRSINQSVKPCPELPPHHCPRPLGRCRSVVCQWSQRRRPRSPLGDDLGRPWGFSVSLVV